MTLYTTPLQFGYFFSLIMGVIFWYRAYQQKRLSDGLFGLIMFLLAMELQDYTFGFAGIHILWEELDGFPRSIHLLFGPAVYFYIKAQINQNFRFGRKDALHLIPYLVYFSVEFFFFINGQAAVDEFRSSQLGAILNIIYLIVKILSYIIYFYASLKLYQQFKSWSVNHFSNQESISFNWYRNFVYLMVSWIAFREIIQFYDMYFDLEFYEDWWWNLALAAIAFYVGLVGYGQKQTQQLLYEDKDVKEKERPDLSTMNNLADKLNHLMSQDSLYLQSELSLNELAQHLKTNSRELSNCINQVFSKNFNDYINGLRIAEFENQIKNKANDQFTLLSIAFDCGFNSKATFNRAFKKAKGITPKEYIDQH